MALFSNTLAVFLNSLNDDQFSKIPEVIQKWHSSESEGWFGLGPAEQKVKLGELAQYIYELIALFEKDSDIKNSEPYQLLERLFREQCEIKNDHPSDEESSQIQIKKKPEGETLQSPYDPDASYGHKGSGAVFISPKPSTIQGKLKSSPTMKRMVPPGPISARLFQLSSVWTLPG